MSYLFNLNLLYVNLINHTVVVLPFDLLVGKSKQTRLFVNNTLNEIKYS